MKATYTGKWFELVVNGKRAMISLAGELLNKWLFDDCEIKMIKQCLLYGVKIPI